MNKKEFLTRLETALATLSYEERQAALRYYEEYLWDAGEENEAAAIAELGAPEALAEKIIRESRAYAKESASAQAQPSMNGAKFVLPFTSINVNLVNAAVTLCRAEGYSVALDFPEAYPLPDVEVRDGTLHIKEKKFSHFPFFGFRSFGFINRAEVTITLPDAQYERFAFDMVNGALKVPPLRVRELKSECVNGAVSIAGVTAERIHLNNVNGKISVSDVSAAESCKCDTVNGGIELSGVLRGRTHADAVNGGISITIPLSGKDYNLNLSTVSGSVRVNGQKMGKSFNVQNGALNSVHAETVNGGIQVGFQSGTIVL